MIPPVTEVVLLPAENDESIPFVVVPVGEESLAGAALGFLPVAHRRYPDAWQVLLAHAAAPSRERTGDGPDGPSFLLGERECGKLLTGEEWPAEVGQRARA